MRAFLALSAGLMALTIPAQAQQPGVPAPEAAAAAPSPAAGTPSGDPRVNQLIVYGNDPCPPSTGDEIIVCARLPEDDRYRIPPNLRSDPGAPENQSWVNRAIELSYVGRSGIGSCSPSGPGGMVGCFNQIVQQARAERGSSDINWTRMIDEAREARMRRIGEAEEEEAEAERQPD